MLTCGLVQAKALGLERVLLDAVGKALQLFDVTGFGLRQPVVQVVTPTLLRAAGETPGPEDRASGPLGSPDRAWRARGARLPPDQWDRGPLAIRPSRPRAVEVSCSALDHCPGLRSRCARQL